MRSATVSGEPKATVSRTRSSQLDVGEASGHGPEDPLRKQVRALDPLGNQELPQRLLVPHLGVAGLGQGLGVGGRDVDVT